MEIRNNTNWRKTLLLFYSVNIIFKNKSRLAGKFLKNIIEQVYRFGQFVHSVGGEGMGQRGKMGGTVILASSEIHFIKSTCKSGTTSK